MKQLTVVQRLPIKLAVLAVTTIASGAYLLWVQSAGLNSHWLYSGPGITYSVGALATLLAAVIGFGINVPTANRMGALAARIASGTRGVALLLIVATAAMAIARYIP